MATTISLSSITAQNIQLSSGQQIASQPQGVQAAAINGSAAATVSDKDYTISQSTSIPGQTTLNYISNMTMSSYMRPIQIDFFAYNLRPNRRMFPYFSDVNVTKLIQRPNIIELDNDVVYYSILPRSSSSLGTLNNNIDPDTISFDKIITMVSDGNGGFTEVISNTSSGTVSGQVDTSRERIRIGTAVADVYFTERANNGRTILYVSNFVDTNANNETVIEVGNTVTGLKSGSFANIASYKHSTGIIRLPIGLDYQANTVGAANSTFVYANLRLSQDASSTEDYTGRTLTLLNGGVPGETVEITSYDANTKVITVSPGVTGISRFDGWSQIYYSIGDARVPYTDQYSDPGLYTTTKGFFAGTLFIPGAATQSPYMFRTGEKLFKISDDPGSSSIDATTVAEYVFNAFGIDISRGQIIINNPTSNTVVESGISQALSTTNAPPLAPPAVVNEPITANASTALAGTNSVRRNNPIAQSFYISDVDYPKGVYVPYVDLFFAQKGTLPIELQIRPLNKGFPDSKNIVPNAIAVVESEEVKVSSRPDAANSNTYTRFTFTSPVYLLPDQDYALVVSSNDYDYTIYVSELGEKIIGSDRIVSSQPYLGSLFRSQNSATYDTINSEDMMFVIHKCEFVSQGSVEFFEEKAIDWEYLQTLTAASPNSVFDSFSVQSHVAEVNGTKIIHEYRSTNISDLDMDTNYIEFRPEILVPMSKRKVLYARQYPDVSFRMKLNLSTESKDVSPIVNKEKQNLATAATIINNLELTTGRLIVANTGLGYTYQNTSVAISANTGSGANAQIIRMFEQLGANSNNSGKIATLHFDSYGSGYAEDVNISLTSSDGSNAEILVSTETDKSGGPALARYISKTVTMAPEFNAGDLRVYLTAIRPPQTNLYVYYKVRNNYDIDDISEKNWVRMVERPTAGTESYAYSLEGSPVELEFRPSLTSNNIVYSSNTATFDTFNQFKIKIVLASPDTVLSNIPYVYDMRAIALPGDVA